MEQPNSTPTISCFATFDAGFFAMHRAPGDFGEVLIGSTSCARARYASLSKALREGRNLLCTNSG